MKALTLLFVLVSVFRRSGATQESRRIPGAAGQRRQWETLIGPPFEFVQSGR
jgi:hypothetical protein